MEALDRVFANICRLLIVTIAMTQFGRNTLCKFWIVGIPILEKQVMIRSRRCYGWIGHWQVLSIVTMPLTKAVWPKFAMQVFGDAVTTLV